MEPPVPNNQDDRKRDLLKEVQQDRVTADPISAASDIKPPMPTLQLPGISSSLEDTVRSLVVDTFKDTVQKMTINGITPDVSGSSVSFSIPVAPRASEQFQAINPPATLSAPIPPPISSSPSPASEAPPVPASNEPARTQSSSTTAVSSPDPQPAPIPVSAPSVTSAPPTPPVLLSPVMPSTTGVTASTTGTPDSDSPRPPSFTPPPPPVAPAGSPHIPPPSLNLSAPALPPPNLDSLALPTPPVTPAPKLTVGQYFDAKDESAREFTRGSISSGAEGFSLSGPTTGLAGMDARQARQESYKEAGMDAVSIREAEAEFTQQQKAYQEFKASGKTGDANDVLREEGGVLSDKRGRNEMRGEFEARIEERQNVEKQNGANVSESIKNGDSSYLSKGFVPVLFTRADGQRKIVVQLDNSCASVVEGAAAGERVTGLPDDSAYYLAEKGGTFAFKLTPFTENDQARIRVTYGEINGTPPDGMVQPSDGNPEGGFILSSPDTGFIFAIITFNETTREITSRTISFGDEIPDDEPELVHFLIGEIEKIPGVGDNPDTYRVLHQAQAGHINFVECEAGYGGYNYFHKYNR